MIKLTSKQKIHPLKKIYFYKKKPCIYKKNIVPLHKFRLYKTDSMNTDNRKHNDYPLGAVQLAPQASVFYCFIVIKE